MNWQNQFSPSTGMEEVWTCLEVDVGAVSHQGLVRDTNQDSFLVMRFGRSLENIMTNLDEDLFEPSYSMVGYGLLVADGMGGMAGGDVASRLTVSKLIELIVDTSDWTLALKHQKDVMTVLERMTERFFQVDDLLRKEADNDPTLQGMGTTLTVAGALGSDLIIGHVGDSRAYLMDGDKFTQLTTDHTLAQALIDAGVANPDDPASRSMRHVLTAAIGSLGEQIDPQVQRIKLRAGDKLLLCSDGLTEMVDDATIAQVLRETSSAQGACQSLLDLALAGGGTDNITVVLAHFLSA